jgi:DNA-directed RNA polymerase subunit RPC12/RpoP
MPGSEYECGECRHRFRTPDGVPHDTRSLMCPACGSIDLTLMDVERPRPPVMRAREDAAVGKWARPRESGTS